MAELAKGSQDPNPTRQSPITLVCFALKEEVKSFDRFVGLRPHVRILLTGIGSRNAEKTLRAALVTQRPKLVLSCGFAGGLRPGLASGTVVFAADAGTALGSALLAAGAEPARFHCARRVAATAEEKRLLWESTGADAVEMESGVICAICREQKTPNAIVRVVLDTASQDLPLDFNQLMTAGQPSERSSYSPVCSVSGSLSRGQRMDYGKLALAVIKSPGKIAALLRLRGQARTAAGKLAEVLVRILFLENLKI